MSSTKRNILLVVEGGKQEPQLFSAILREYDLDGNYELYSYNTNIYELYERMFTEGKENLEALSFLGVLKEREKDPKLRALLDKDYSDVLLIFDFDCQDNRFSFARLAEMQNYFSESTDEGKLYINYPMVEACKHFKTMPDEEYFSRKASLDVAYSKDKNLGYKALVNRESDYQSFERDFTRNILDSIIILTVKKSLNICGFKSNSLNFSELCRRVNHAAILSSQQELFKISNAVYVLGTCVLFVCDYSTDLIHIAES